MSRWTPLLALTCLLGCGVEEPFEERTFLDQWWEPDYEGSIGEEILDRYGETCVLFDSASFEAWFDTVEGYFGPYQWREIEADTLKVVPLGKLTVEPLPDHQWKVTLSQRLSKHHGKSLTAGPCDRW